MGFYPRNGKPKGSRLTIGEGETDLQVLLSSLQVKLWPDTYVFVTLPLGSEKLPELLALSPRMIFQEEEGTSLILTRKQAEAANVPYEFPCRMITLDVHSGLDAVGFIAHISTALAKAGMGVNPVAGFYHDHLFVPEGREDEAMVILNQIAI